MTESNKERGDVSVENLICDCKDSGQIMEQSPIGGYQCPNCGQVAEYRLRWGDNCPMDPTTNHVPK